MSPATSSAALAPAMPAGLALLNRTEDVRPTETIRDAALLLAKRRGKPVFPCKPDKKPYTNHGLHDATTDEATIRKWWAQYPDALIGLPTGNVSGLVVMKERRSLFDRLFGGEHERQGFVFDVDQI